MLETLTRPMISLTLGGVLLALFASQFEAVESLAEPERPSVRIMVEPTVVGLPRGVRLDRDLVFSEPATGPLRLDLYRPEALSEPVPVIVYIHGGGWRSGDKNSPAILELTGKGYALASIEYRLSDQAVFPAQLDDCREAIRWLRQHATQWSLNPQRIGVCGVSAGGHLAALLGVTAPHDPRDAELTRVQAVADFFGPTDLLSLSEPDVEDSSTRIFSADAFSPEALLLGASPHANPELARSASPLHLVQSGNNYPPFFIAHGHSDAVIPWQQSYYFALELRKHDVDVNYFTSDAGHQQHLLPEQLDRLCDFFDRNLKPATPTEPELLRPRRPLRLTDSDFHLPMSSGSSSAS